MAEAGNIEGGARPRHDIGVCQKCVSVEQVSSVLLGGGNNGERVEIAS